jgi:hypothetical protein
MTQHFMLASWCLISGAARFEEVTIISGSNNSNRLRAYSVEIQATAPQAFFTA